MNSIKTKLILLIVAALFIVSVTLGVVSYIQARKTLMKQTETSFLGITSEIAKVIEANMRVNIAIVETIAERRIIDDNTPWPEKLAFMEKEAKRTGFEVFAIADIKGNSMRFNAERATAKVSDRDYYIRAMQGISTYSSVFISRVTGLPSVAVASPIKRNGQIAGVLYGIRDGGEITRLVEDVNLGRTGYAYVINKEGTIQGHKNTKLVLDMFNPINSSEKDKSLLPLVGMLKNVLSGRTGVEQYFFNGKDIYGAYTPIKGTDNWSVVLAMELSEILEEVNHLRNVNIIITLTVLIIGGILAYFIGRSIANPIIATVRYSEKMAELDLTEDVDAKYLSRNDEIGTLAKSFQTLIDILRKTVVEIIKAAQQVATATEQIGQDNQNLSQRTSEQASSLEEIAAAIEEANASTKQNSDNALSANTFAESSLKLAREGGTIVENAVTSIVEINSSSSKIADIINMINEIAFQTNLLALNAAVEAARAGEQGRGFAVVAGEVRNLAQRAGNAAKEIDSLIKDSVSKIDNGTNLVNRSGLALKEIIESVQKANILVSEMAASSDEQRRGIEQINTAVMDMDTMTQQNAALVEETAAASEEMSSQAQELLSMIKRFNVGEAAERISEFKSNIPGSIEKKTKKTVYTGPEKLQDVNLINKTEIATSQTGDKKDIFADEDYEKF